VDPPSGGPHVSPDGIVDQGVTEIDVESVSTAVDWLDGLARPGSTASPAVWSSRSWSPYPSC
jgi:hypothetical protein